MTTAIAGFVSAGAGAAYVTGQSGGGAAERPDCPGKIVCPITGDMVCIDQCPLEQDAAVSLPVAEAAPLPACCAEKK